MIHADVADARPAGSTDARMNYNVNGKLFSTEQMPAHLPA